MFSVSFVNKKVFLIVSLYCTDVIVIALQKEIFVEIIF